MSLQTAWVLLQTQNSQSILFEMEHLSVCFRRHCWNRKPTRHREDKAWKDQSRVAVEHQNLHHEEQGPGQQQRKKRNQSLWIHRWRPAFLWASLLEECPSAAEKQTFQSTSRCAQILAMCFSFSSQHAVDLLLIKTCLFSLMTCKAVTVLTSEAFQPTSRHLSWAITLLFLEDTWWCSPTWGLRRSTS